MTALLSIYKVLPLPISCFFPLPTPRISIPSEQLFQTQINQSNKSLHNGRYHQERSKVSRRYPPFFHHCLISGFTFSSTAYTLSNPQTPTDTFLNSFVGDKANELTSGASKEANKNVAKDSDASVGTRASAAKDAVSDKGSELSSSVS